MSKNVVICCDGTANEFAIDRTNVLKLFFTLVHDHNQLAFYHPGIGTMEPAGANTPIRRKAAKVLGQAIGYGLEYDIADAYTFLMNHFEAGDQLFVFGFSRGAYTVRAVTSLLHMYGLIRRGNEPLIRYAIRMMVGLNRLQRNRTKQNTQELLDQVQGYFKLAEEFKAHFCSVPCNPHFVGVWDTVSSVGWIENPTRLPYTSNNPDIAIGRHAVAIDERRAFFRTNLWRPTVTGGPKDIKQVWFPGVHCDVGGGYAEAESGLSKIALKWMLDEAAAAGLLTDPAKVALVLGQVAGSNFVAPNPHAEMHESLKGFWNLAEFVPKRHYDWAKQKEERRMNLYRRRTMPADALVHVSAWQRGNDYKKRLPPGATPVP
jgi:uncharacterized protein (DUF2235 family)